MSISLKANDIEAAEKKKAVLLSGVRANTFSLLRIVLCPAKPGEMKHMKNCEMSSKIISILNQVKLCKDISLTHIHGNREKLLQIIWRIEEVNKAL